MLTFSIKKSKKVSVSIKNKFLIKHGFIKKKYDSKKQYGWCNNEKNSIIKDSLYL